MHGNGRSSLCAQQAGLAERAFQKIVLERQLADLGMKGFQIDGWRSGFGTSLSPEYPGRPFKELRLPLGDLVGMDIELLRQIGQRLLAFDRGQSHFRLEGRCVAPACSLAHRLSCSTAILAVVRQKLHLSSCPSLSGQLSQSCAEWIRGYRLIISCELSR